MNIQKQFQYDPSIDVTASQIGISKWNWTYIKSNDISEATTIMKKNRFDVLPIENADGLVTSYYSTVEWNNYDHLNISKILEAQTIYYRMSLKDLIKKFMDDKRHFYFLTDYSQILGLVSFVNLNCQLVYNYLFYLLSDIERSVSTLLKNHIHQDTVIMMLKSSTDNHQQEVYKSYIKNVEANQDVDIFQLMYLQMCIRDSLRTKHCKILILRN